jgi:gluconokinase
MGVAASGKTTVGRAVAAELGWRFVDADDFHAKRSRDKMRAGLPLTEHDRRPWLQRLHKALTAAAVAQTPVVLACSALTARYRQLLIGDLAGVCVAYLRVTPEVARQRIGARTHFFNPDLLADQFDLLEEPDDAVALDASRPVEDIVSEIVARLR